MRETLIPADGVEGTEYFSMIALSTSVSSPSASTAQEGVFELPGAFKLHFGGQLDRVRMAWRLVGESGPVVVALGGISAGRYVTGNTPQGWWSGIVGEGAPLDLRRFRVLGMDFLGGSGQSTGPSRGQTNFPSISAYDQADALRQLIEHLKFASVHAIVGASYGGMVALAFAERFPQLVHHAIVISAADRSHPMSTAWRSVQRATVRYALKKDDGPEGLRLARALAMATYRSANEFEQRFDAEPVRIDGRFQFPVETYLLARGDAYAASYLPEAFLCLSESIDLHRVDATRIAVPVTLVGVREDQIVPLADMQALRGRLAGPAQLVEVSSLYGHDAFLKEADTLRRVFDEALGNGR